MTQSSPAVLGPVESSVMQHTPGPWTVRNIATRDHYIGPANDGGAPSVGFALSRVCSTEAQVSANARLMAAAPELLECLRALLDEHPGTKNVRIVKARAAIAKAVGRDA